MEAGAADVTQRKSERMTLAAVSDPLPSVVTRPLTDSSLSPPWKRPSPAVASKTVAAAYSSLNAVSAYGDSDLNLSQRQVDVYTLRRSTALSADRSRDLRITRPGDGSPLRGLSPVVPVESSNRALSYTHAHHHHQARSRSRPLGRRLYTA